MDVGGVVGPLEVDSKVGSLRGNVDSTQGLDVHVVVRGIIDEGLIGSEVAIDADEGRVGGRCGEGHGAAHVVVSL